MRGVVKEELEPVVRKLDALWDQTVRLTKDMLEVQDNQSTQIDTLKQIVTNTEHYKDNTIKFDKRIHVLEDHAGIVPPPEFTIAS